MTRTEVAHPADRNVHQSFDSVLCCHRHRGCVRGTLVVQDVLGERQHAGEDAAEEKSCQARPNKEKRAAGVENEQHQHRDNGTCLEE